MLIKCTAISVESFSFKGGISKVNFDECTVLCEFLRMAELRGF